jgi:hypothetical protein
MAPEVWQMRPGRYSDQYALAVTCFYLLCGDLPWHRKEGMQSRSWIHLHNFVPPRSILELRPDLPIAVDLVLRRAMAKNPHERYATVSAFAADLLTAAQDITQNLVALIDTHKIASNPAVKVGEQAAPGRVGSPRAVERVSNPASPAPIPQGTDLSYPARVDRPVEVMPARPGEQPVTPPALTLQEPDTAPVDESREPQLLRLGHSPGKAAPLKEVTTEEFAPAEKYGRWVLDAVLLNLLVCLALAGETLLQYGQSPAGTFLLAIWPAVLVGPLLALLFRRVHFTTLSWGLFWGAFFGLSNGLLSALVCLVWAVVAAGVRCSPWCGPGGDLTVAMNELTAMAQYAILPIVAGLWVSVIGGALIGIFNIRYEDAEDRGTERQVSRR